MTLRKYFDLDLLADEAKAPWSQDLLAAWAPAGSQPQGKRLLRVGVRDGYLNFYCCGQSIAKVCIGRGRIPRIEVHRKYAFGDVEGAEYARLSGTRLSCKNGDLEHKSDYVPGSGFSEWIERASTRKESQKEKRLLESVVAANPQVIDLEMGIPAWDEQLEDAPWRTSDRKFAPRMDLVLLEETDEGKPRIAFWEVKTASSDDWRSTSEPKVMRQMGLYQRYLTREKYREGVREAYRDACVILTEVHSAASAAEKLPPLGKLIREVAGSGVLPEIDITPRLLILADAKDKPGVNDRKYRNAIRDRGFPVLLVESGSAKRRG